MPECGSFLTMDYMDVLELFGRVFNGYLSVRVGDSGFNEGADLFHGGFVGYGPVGDGVEAAAVFVGDSQFSTFVQMKVKEVAEFSGIGFDGVGVWQIRIDLGGITQEGAVWDCIVLR